MKQYFLFLSFFICFTSSSQKRKTENVIIITLDGFRWQELFAGADSALINDSIYVSDREALNKKYWAATADERRKKLMPFFWNQIALNGQLYGNRLYNNKIDNTNKYWFSYPGYNEIFTGYPDDSVNTNDKKMNANVNVLEFINKLPAYKGKVAAFTSWDVFDAIFNEPRSKFLVSSGFDTINDRALTMQLLNDMQSHSPQPLGDGVRPDHLTYYIAKEYIKLHRPRVVYIGFDETDDWAHEGKYDNYLNAGNLIDNWMADLWNFIQAIPQYKNKTTLLITTDHGRGDKNKKDWRSHGQKVEDSHEIWMAVTGPDTKPLGEIKKQGQLYQRQIATTIAALLGLEFKPDHPVMKPIDTVIK
jgi:hypothetical protein